MDLPFDEGEIACTQCGRVWYLTKDNTIQRNPDSLECKCGKTLHSWRGACDYSCLFRQFAGIVYRVRQIRLSLVRQMEVAISIASSAVAANSAKDTIAGLAAKIARIVKTIPPRTSARRTKAPIPISISARIAPCPTVCPTRFRLSH